MGKKNKIPAKVKQYWCYGCLDFVIIDWKKGMYYCAKRDEYIHPSQEVSCKARRITGLFEDDDTPEDEFDHPSLFGDEHELPEVQQ